MSGHTLGPWLDPATLEWIYEPQKLLTNRADALVMGFAPDLLEALEKAQAILTKRGIYGPDMDQISAAIAKAKGQPS